MLLTKCAYLSLVLSLAVPVAMKAGDIVETATEPIHEGHGSPKDLSILDFFTSGWDETWVHRHDRTTQDMALLRVTTNALEQEFRTDYSETYVRGNAKIDTQQLGNTLIAYAVNRRLMVEVINNYQWNKDFLGRTSSGSGGGGLARFQLADSLISCTSFQVKVSEPNKGIGQTQTSIAYGLASWQDLHAWLPGLGRVGVHESVTYENLQGPLPKVGARTKDVAADISLTKTWTSPDTPWFRNFTTFLETYATRDLDGLNEGHTVTTVTPGVRSWFSKKQSWTLGLDLPLGARGSSYRVVRATYILNF